MDMRDEHFMNLALQLARNGLGRTSPNPVVGALVVRNDAIIGQGWHQKAGTPHAEIHALRDAGSSAQGATLYVTLEPCCHHGRTGPCTDAIIRAGINRVVFAMTDPNPCVAGCGASLLRQAGIEVTEGILACEAAKQSRRDIVPTISPNRDLREIVSQCPQNTTILLLYEGKAPLCIGDALSHPADSYLVLIGPEGGFSQSEVEFCQQHGAQCVTLGPRILRTETASLATLAIILYQCGDLGGLLCRK